MIFIYPQNIFKINLKNVIIKIKILKYKLKFKIKNKLIIHLIIIKKKINIKWKLINNINNK